MSGAAVDVAVVGMSCRFPGVGGVGEFWRLLVDGVSTVGSFPERRVGGLGGSDYLSHPDAAAVAAGSFFDAVDGFDAGFFGISAAEAAAMDPVQRLGLELAWEAVEDAGVPAGALAGRVVDVLVGAGSSGYEVLRRVSGGDRDDHYAALGSSGGLIANRISGLFDVRGMSFCADSGQSSSLVALALACERIRGGAVEMAIVGGVNLVVDPGSGVAMANLGALSPDGRCFAFDGRASGFVRGEGGGFVVLKRADLAVADGDRVYAVVRGWGVGSGGASSRMPDPSSGAQAATVLSALACAGVSFEDVDYVEAHGTGTRLGDPAEVSGLREVFRATGRSRPVVIGSVKTNVGHLEPAAGIVGFVKAALCVERGWLVPSLNFESANPAVEDFDRDFEVVRVARSWPVVSGRPRRAGVSSFGMGGTNAHVILEAFDAQAEQEVQEVQAGSSAVAGLQVPGEQVEQAGPPSSVAGLQASGELVGRAGSSAVAGLQASGGQSEDCGATARQVPVAVWGVVPWVLSARSVGALRELAVRLGGWVAADGSLSVADVGYSLVSTRSVFEHRAVVWGGGREQVLAGLDVVAAGGDAARVVRGVAAGSVGPVVFVFPGQGSQWLGMGKRLYAQSAVFAGAIDECARALDPWLDWSLVDLVTGAESAPSLERGDAVVQPALFAMMVSLARVWRSLGVVPDVVVGHSQGELAAACVAGALSLEDAARVVALRSQALAGLAGVGGLRAVFAPVGWVEERLGRWPGRLCLGAVNGPASVVISGDLEALDAFAAMAAVEGVRVRRVRIEYASHSHHVERIRDRVLEAAAGVVPRRCGVEFYSTVTGGLLDTRRLDGGYWYDNLRSMVRFGEVVESLMRERGGVFVEVSPHPVLNVAMEETADALDLSPVVVGTLHKDDGSADSVLASLAELYVRGVPVDWQAVFTGQTPRRVRLPTYPFQRQRYWLTAPDDTDTTGTGTGTGTKSSTLAVAPGVHGPNSTRVAGLDSPVEVLRLVCAETATVLGEKGADLTGTDLAGKATVTFKDLGFDSSMAVRLRNRITTVAGVRLPATIAFTYPTPDTLAHHIHTLLQPETPTTPEAAETSEAPAPETPDSAVAAGPETAGPEDRSDDELYELIDRGYV